MKSRGAHEEARCHLGKVDLRVQLVDDFLQLGLSQALAQNKEQRGTKLRGGNGSHTIKVNAGEGVSAFHQLLLSELRLLRQSWTRQLATGPCLHTQQLIHTSVLWVDVE